MTDLDSRMELFTKYLDRTNMEHKEYQYEGVRWCLNNELRDDPPCDVRGGFIADEMGLGKTIMMRSGSFIAILCLVH
jgi:SNF2 family DNA or RNA helicase